METFRSVDCEAPVHVLMKVIWISFDVYQNMVLRLETNSQADVSSGYICSALGWSFLTLRRSKHSPIKCDVLPTIHTFSFLHFPFKADRLSQSLMPSFHIWNRYIQFLIKFVVYETIMKSGIRFFSAVCWLVLFRASLSSSSVFSLF